MKLLFCTPYFLPTKGGQQYSSYFLIDSLIKMGYEVTLLTFKKGNMDEIVEDISKIKIIRIHSNFEFGRTNWSFQLMQVLPNLIQEHDLVHVNIPSPLFVDIITLYARFYKKKIFVSQRGEPELNSVIKKLIYKLYMNFVLRFTLKYVDLLHFTSIEYYENVKSRFGIFNYDKKNVIIPHGVNPYFLMDRDLKNDYKKGAIENFIDSIKDEYLLFVGSLHKDNEYKGLLILLKAFIKIGERFEKLKLIIVGDGELKNKYIQFIENEVKNEFLKEKILFLGAVDNKNLRHIYDNCKLFVLPSLGGPESFGIVLAEAICFGKPIIVSNIPGPNSFFREKNAGLLFEPNNPLDLSSKIEEILNDETKYMYYSKNAFELYEKYYNWKKIIIIYDKYYKKMLSTR